MRNFFIPTVLILASTLSSGCSPAGDAAAAVESETINLEMASLQFVPDEISVNVGDTLVWHNKDIVPHTIDNADKSWESGSIGPDGSFTLVATTADTISITCRFHPTMTATLIISDQ